MEEKKKRTHKRERERERENLFVQENKICIK